MTKYRRVQFLLRISILLFLAIFAPAVRSDQTVPTSSPLPQSESIKAQADSDIEPPADVFITDQGLSSPEITISVGDTIRWMNETYETAQIKSTTLTTIIYLPTILKGGDEVETNEGIGNGLSGSSTPSSQDTELDSGDILSGGIFSHTFEQPGQYSYTLFGVSDSTNNLSSAATTIGTINVVSTTEGLEPADISLEEPVSGFVAAGTGMNSQPGTIDIDVPEGVTIKKVLLYWSGATPQSNPGDDTIEVSNTSTTEIVTGDLIGGPHFFYTQAYFSSFRADITDLNLVGVGSNTLTIDEMAFGTEDNGTGVLVIFDDGSSTATFDLRDGLDLAHFNFPEPRKSTVPQTFNFNPSDSERAADLLFFVGSIGTNRPNSIDITFDGPDIESSTTELVNPFESADGPEWDTLIVPISIPAGASSVTVEVISTNTFNPRGASLAWIATALSISPGADLAITKSAEPNAATAGESLTYELNVTNNGPSSATGVVVTDELPDEVSFVSVIPTPDCSEADGTVTCNLGNLAANDTISMTIEVTVDELATGTLLNTASVTSETNDPVPGNNSVALETSIVEVLLSLDPPEATNNIGDDHIITAKLQLDGGDVEGETITFVIDESSTAGSILENPAECTTDVNGECTITLQSDAIGVTDITANWSGTLNESPVSASATATKNWIEVRLVLSPEVAANQVGDTHDITGTLQFDDGGGFQDATTTTGDINFVLDSGPGDLTLTCTPVDGSCATMLTSDTTGESQVSADWSGTIDIGGEAIVSVVNPVEAAPVSKTWVDARLTLEVITGSEFGASILDQHTIQATLEIDFGDGAGFVLAPAGEQIDFFIISGPGILAAPEFCITLADGTCTIDLDFDQTSLSPGGTVEIGASWTGEIGAEPVTVTASATTSTEALFFSVQATIIDAASEIECDPEDDVPNSVFGPNGLDPSGTGTSFNPLYEIPSLVFEPNGDQAVVFNCLFNDEDVDLYWMAPTDTSREVYIGMTTNGEANYDIAVFVDLHLGDGDIKLEAVSLIDTQSVDSSGSMSSGSMSSGSMSSGSMSSGSMSSGSMSSGSMSSGSMSSGSMSSGSMSSGSFNSGNVDERAAAHIEAGQTVFIAVLSQAGDFGPEYEMRVDVLNTDEGVCTWSPDFPTTITPPALPSGAGKDTGFFINIGRFEATYGTARTQALLDALQNPLFLNDSTVQGVVVPIEQDPAVAAAYNDWNATGNYCKIAKANGVAEALRNLIIGSYGDLDQIVIVGGPEMIPPHLVMEGPVEISPESDYEIDSQADADSPIRWWLMQNRVQTYDIYVDNNGPFIRYLGNNLYQPEKPIGVLVETPENIIQVINNYNNSGLQPQSCLNTGYEHLTDAAQAIDGLIDLPTQSLISENWTGADVLAAFATNPELVSFNGHFSHWFAEPATRTDVVYAPQIVSSLISNQVGATMGCHSGMNMPNNWVSGASPTPEGFHPSEDFAEVLLGNGWAAWYATIPFAYGDDEAFKYTEQIMFNFFKALDSSSGGATVGEAYLSSKQEYFEQMAAGDFDIYDIKSLRGAALYGLPFQHVSIPLSVALETLDPTIGPAQKAALLASPDVDPGALVTQSEPVQLPNSAVSLYASNQVFNLEQVDTPRGSYLRRVGGSNADVVVSPGRPLQPLVSVELSGQPHGATLVTASYHDLTDFDPVVTNPVTETTRLESLLSKNRWLPPSDGLFVVNLLGSTPRLNMIPGQYNTDGRIERVYDSMNVEVYTSNSDSYHPPGIWNPTTTCDGDDVTFEVKVEDADGIQVVNVAYNDTANSMWKTTANLSVSAHPDDDGSFLATGTFALGPNVEFFIQAVDNDGNVNFDSNFGLNYLTCTHPPDATNNFVDSGENTHSIEVDLEINFGEDWEAFPGLALLSGDLVSLEGAGSVDVSACVNGTCTILITGITGNSQTILTFNPDFTVQAVDEDFNVLDEFSATLSGDTPPTFVKDWWSGSISVFKQIREEIAGEICFTLSGSGAGETTSDNPQCLPFEGPSNLLFTWENLPTGDDYAVTEAPPPAPLVGEGLIEEDIILDEGHRNALVRTVLNNAPVLTCNLGLDKECLVPATEDTTCDSKIAATLLRYTGPTILDATVKLEPHNHKASTVTYEHVDLISGELLAPLGGFTIDARPEDLGPKLTVTIKNSNGQVVGNEIHHTSCSVPYVVGQPAPLNSGGSSPNWSVVSFVEKDGEFVTEEQRGDECVVASGTDVTYLYSLTNHGSPLTDVTVSDNKLGEIGVFETFGTGEAETLSKTATINKTTYNVASATGFLAPDLTCSAPNDTVVVTAKKTCDFHKGFFNCDDDDDDDDD